MIHILNDLFKDGISERQIISVYFSQRNQKVGALMKFKNVVNNPRILSQFDLLKMLRLKDDEAKAEFMKRSLEGCFDQKMDQKNGQSSN